MKSITRKTKMTAALLCVLALFGVALIAIIASTVNAVPEGPTITSFTNSTKVDQNGTVRTDGKGTINFARFNAIAQNKKWKAYVGNITGTLVLQDSDGYNIYDWKLTSALSGTVLASRNNTLNWSGIKCLNTTTIGVEQIQLQFLTSQEDNINRTFNATNHTNFTINSINLGECPAAYTYINSTRQVENNSANLFQEIAIQDDLERTAYATRIHADIYSYRSNISDFQLLIPDFGNTSNTNTATYYFFVELT
ncbi:MAG: hypothetical protein AABX51_08615 [Nanoarchaeota archaeon]